MHFNAFLSIKWGIISYFNKHFAFDMFIAIAVMKQYLLLALILCSAIAASAQVHTLTGKVTTEDGKPVSFASVFIRNSTYGSSANELGEYQFKLAPGTYSVFYRFPGYKEILQNVTITNKDVQLNVKMQDEFYQLRQYKKIKKGITDSAVNVIKLVMKNRDSYLKDAKNYSCAVYIKGVQKLVSAPKGLMGKNVTDALQMDSTGRGILYQSESLSSYNFQAPGKIKEVMIASKTAGQNASFGYNRASDLSVNFYKDVFTVPGLSTHGFISPLAKNAMRYYHYQYLGTKIENGLSIDKIQVIPKRQYTPTFTGNIYVVEGSWRLYSVDLMLTNKANALNLVDTLVVSQQYTEVRDSVWEPLSVQYSFKGNVFGFKFEGYYLGIYNNYQLDPFFQKGYFNGEIMRTDSSANSRDSAYWKSVRPVPLTTQENQDYIKKDRITALKQSLAYREATLHSKNQFNVIPYIPFGYTASNIDNRDSLYIYPFIQTLFYNTVEGLGLNLKARLSRNLDDQKKITITPDVRYGFSSKQLNANVNAEYLYDPWHRGKWFAGFGSDVLDLNNAGTRSLYFNTLSTLLSERNYVKYYHSQYAGLGFEHEITNGILWKAEINYANRTQLYNTSAYTFKTFDGRHLTSNNPLNPDAPTYDRSMLFPQNQALTFNTSFIITFDQQYLTRPTGKVLLPSAYPQVTLNYRKGIDGVFGSDVNYDFGSIQISQDHMPIGVIGYSAFKITAGSFFNQKKLYFMDYYHFSGNQGTTIDPSIGSFHFLPFYTYSTTGGFLEAHYEHNFAGYIFNNIPLLRKLKLDEIFGANYLTENYNRNYTEVYIGVQRLIFRVDYGVSFDGSHKYMQGIRIFYGIK